MQPHTTLTTPFFLKDVEITTGLLNNATGIKIHLVTGQLLYHQNEVADFIDLFAADDIIEEINMIVTKYGLDTRPIAGSSE